MNKHEAIYKTHPNVVSISGDEAFDVAGNKVIYDEVLVQAYLSSRDYIEKRQAEYPSYADQFDTIFHEGIDEWKTKIQTVKNKYPKG